MNISTNLLSRALKPSIVLEMTLDDGTIFEMESSVAKFQDLRYHVAKLLKEIQEIEKSSLYKIAEKTATRLS